eukprot:TRINITY_DN49092_c0_g1_i2.p1 TRINITY_DN49092_c0_g1~~TRINITY_DN49092_c0_g1_i2.p1  ORF type:complete len:134 (-),score=6.83 TRINITY_DN49092_c0_g1_i2:375-776(-)
MIRDFKSLPSSGFHLLLAMHLVKKATKDPREVTSKRLFMMLHSDLFFMRNRISSQTLSLKFGIFPIDQIGILTHHHNQAKPIMKLALTLSCTRKKTHYKLPIVIQIICSVFSEERVLIDGALFSEERVLIDEV